MSIILSNIFSCDCSYFFSKYDFASEVRCARLRLEATQLDLATKAGLQVNSIKRIESGAGDTGILTSIAVAEALDLPLPSVTPDSDVLKFAENLFVRPDQAAEDYDRLFYRVCEIENENIDFVNSELRPNNLLWLSGLERKGFAFPVTLREPFFMKNQLYSSLCFREAVSPLELAFLFEDMAMYCKGSISPSTRRKLYTLPAPFWRHVVTGRSNNVGLAKLLKEIRIVEESFIVIQQEELKDGGLRTLVVAAFYNLYLLKKEMRRAARLEDAKYTDDYAVYLASYIRLLNYTKSQLVKMCKVSKSLRAALDGLSKA
ncbi:MULTISPECIES: helix-turn-helix transcriptional regulator [unclassified Lentimonas]|uniref:helix-turn-helix domain-containing protein n=1 Tax=unclassified Lentimonas TaxID=2630993 RepID=UPI0013205CD5|nr:MULTISPECIES: helix-turn-helix transcriptional regulator [unclassified Lentimonas]CAA6679315.1 Unannotated [Lentimonas sp. CC4]CAA6686352.1 Unannotated [Lentimonas sp. CC6]CAA7076126.1 Unannotated [Lentimonas sp. CC4]CAA7170881.1 Unannotated [Lentimonas sp. CC21]CAA7181177.1 Unannotated [Lentimonas sp. CC8]